MDTCGIETLELARTERTSCRATVSQEYFYYLEQRDPDPRSFAHTTVLQLDGPLDRDALVRSVEAVLARHSVYRTTMAEENGRVIQRVVPAEPCVVEVIDRSPLPESAWADACNELVRERTGKAFDVGRLLHAVVLGLAPDRHRLILIIHHAVSDGGSTEALIHEVFAVYARLRAGAPAFATAEPPLQFIDYAASLETWADSPSGRAQRARWTEILDGATPLKLPVDQPRDDFDAFRDSVPRGIVAELMLPAQRIEIPAATVAAVAALSRAERTSPYAVYLAAFAATLRERSNQDDISIEVSYSPRFNLRLHRLLKPLHGLLTTWAIARVDLKDAATFTEQVRRARRTAMQVNELGPIHDYYQIVPVGLRRAIFNYLPLMTRRSAELAPQLQGTRLGGGFPVWKRPWELHLTVLDGKASTQMLWTGNARLFRPETTRQYLDAFLARLPT